MLISSVLLAAGCALACASPLAESGNAVELDNLNFKNDLISRIFKRAIQAPTQFQQPIDEEVAPVRRRRLADDKKLDLKMRLQRIKKVVSMDAIGSYSLYRSQDRKTSLKAFGSTELWYDGKGFGVKKPGMGVQFTIFY